MAWLYQVLTLFKGLREVEVRNGLHGSMIIFCDLRYFPLLPVLKNSAEATGRTQALEFPHASSLRIHLVCSMSLLSTLDMKLKAWKCC